MDRRRLLATAAILPLVWLAACGGSSSTTPATQPDPGSTLPPVDLPSNGYDHASGADDVVIRVGYDGGFTTPETEFLDLPLLLVTGDGRLFQQGAVILIYPGPLLPFVQVRTISDAGIQQLLGMADENGLLADREYERNDLIADAPDTVVTLTVGGTTYTHRADALGLGGGPDGGETDAARIALAEFVASAQALATGPADDVLGPEATFEPETYLARSLIVGDAGDGDIEPTLVPWPADASVALDGEFDCRELPADGFGLLFVDATQLTWFTSEGSTYQLAVKPQLPGTSC